MPIGHKGSPCFGSRQPACSFRGGKNCVLFWTGDFWPVLVVYRSALRFLAASHFFGACPPILSTLSWREPKNASLGEGYFVSRQRMIARMRGKVLKTNSHDSVCWDAKRRCCEMCSFMIAKEQKYVSALHVGADKQKTSKFFGLPNISYGRHWSFFRRVDKGNVCECTCKFHMVRQSLHTYRS